MITNKGLCFSGITINIRKVISYFFFFLYFCSLTIYANTFNNTIIIFGLLSCFFIFILNLKKVEYSISSYIGVFVITLTSQINYLLPYSIVNFIFLLILFRKKILNSINKPLVMMFLFVGCIGISIVNSVEPELAKEAFVAFSVSIIIYYSITLLSQSAINLEDLYWFSCLFIVGMILVFFLNHSIQDLAKTHRALIYFIGNSGTRSNTLAGYIAILLFISVGCWRHNKSLLRKIVAISCFFSMCIILYFIISRGAYLGIAVSLIPLLLFNVSKRRFLIINSISIFILLFMIFFSKEIFDSRAFGLSTGDYSNGRWEYYRLAIEQFKIHPLIGNGMYQFGFLAGMNRLEDPHNWLLAYLTGIGIIGTMFFCLFLFPLLKKIFEVFISKNTDKKLIALAQAITVPIIHGLVEPAMSTSLPFMLFCILSPILYNYKPNRETNNF